jgi:hypothetical protein
MQRHSLPLPVDLRFAKKALSLLRFPLSAHIDTTGLREVPGMFTLDAEPTATIDGVVRD